ncbi:hypothetical protein CDD83_1362 [Cordyceps sp. RAO-2017]|nr:hypothetical protein CDD83_1362 [Cordyceps sp. RAO-2017]
MDRRGRTGNDEDPWCRRRRLATITLPVTAAPHPSSSILLLSRQPSTSAGSHQQWPRQRQKQWKPKPGGTTATTSRDADDDQGRRRRQQHCVSEYRIGTRRAGQAGRQTQTDDGRRSPNSTRGRSVATHHQWPRCAPKATTHSSTRRHKALTHTHTGRDHLGRALGSPGRSKGASNWSLHDGWPACLQLGWLASEKAESRRDQAEPPTPDSRQRLFRLQARPFAR